MRTNDQIIKNVLNGERHAFRVIVDDYQDLVYTLCFKVIKHQEMAEEAAQDVFVKVFKKLHQFDGRSSFKTWIYRIAHRTAIDYYRKKKPTMVDLEDVSYNMSSAERTSHQDMEQREEHAALRRAIAQLKQADASVITLFYLEELNMEEISGILNMTAGNVKVRLHRARHRLAKLISEHNLQVG